MKGACYARIKGGGQMIILLLIAFAVAEECICQCAGLGFGALYFNQTTVNSCKACTAAFCQLDPECEGLTSAQCLDEVDRNLLHQKFILLGTQLDWCL